MTTLVECVYNCTFYEYDVEFVQDLQLKNIVRRLIKGHIPVVCVGITIMLVARGPINNITAWVRIMAWRRSSDKPLSETMIILLAHVCVT